MTKHVSNLLNRSIVMVEFDSTSMNKKLKVLLPQTSNWKWIEYLTLNQHLFSVETNNL